MDLDKKKAKQTVIIIELKKGKVCKRKYRKKNQKSIIVKFHFVFISSFNCELNSSKTTLLFRIH